MYYQNKYLKYKNKYLDFKKQIAQKGGSVINNKTMICATCGANVDCSDPQSINLDCKCCLHEECFGDYLDSKLMIGGPVTCLNCPNKEHVDECNITSEYLTKIKSKLNNPNIDKLIERFNSNRGGGGGGGDEIDELVLKTSRQCPSCKTIVTHSHGHACHHIMGCPNPNCKQHFCFVCLSTTSTHDCIYNGKLIGKTWSTFCRNIITEKDIDYSTGIPRDNRCGCSFCTECKLGQKCKQCSGDCLVCMGFVKPGPTSILPESERRGWYIEPFDKNNIGVLTRQKLLKIYPDLLSKSVIELDDKKITAIESGTFQNLPALEKLILWDNQITTISRNTFQNLPALKKLTLDNNQITNIESEAFQGLPALEKLTLHNNQITNDSLRAIKDFPSLRILSIHATNITSIDILNERGRNLDSLNYIPLRDTPSYYDSDYEEP